MSLPKQVGYRRENEPRDRMNASQYRIYLEEKVVTGMDIYCEGTSKDWDESFKLEALLHGKKNNNLAVEYVESWSKEESDKMGYEKLYEIGIENARRAFPDFSFVVVPHVNKNGNFHTHVLFNTVSDDGSKRMYSDWKNRNRWNQTVDRSAREYGLSTVKKDYARKEERMSRSAHQMMRRGVKAPHQLQIMQKADFARRIAVSIDEFVTLMGNFGIGVEDRGSVLSYKHPARQKAIRGKTLGQNYQKALLEEAFSKNIQSFKERPKLQSYLKEKISDLPQVDNNSLYQNVDFPFYPGGHQYFTNKTLAKEVGAQSRVANEKDHIAKELPFASHISESINLARSASIPEYCQQNNISLTQVKGGKYLLKGREHIQIEGSKWSNIKDGSKAPKTQGSLIEFVANHKSCSLLEAISEITNNKKLLQLQQYIGKGSRSYKEFHIPKSRQKSEPESLSLITSLVKSMGYKSEVAKLLYKTKKVQVNTKGVVRFLLGKSEGAIDYNQQSDGGWLATSHGQSWSGFLKQQGSSSQKLHVFKDPFAFFEHNRRGMMGFKSSDNVLVLDGRSNEALDLFIAQRPKIKNIDLFGFGHKKLNKTKKLELTKNGLRLNFYDSASSAKDRGKGADLSL